MKLVPDHIWGIMTVWMEARGEPFEGKVAVAEVILRRTLWKYNSDGTIAGTCLRKYQFSGWNTDDPNRIKASGIDSDNPVVQECIKAWKEAEAGSDYSKGATLYYAPKACDPYWSRNAIETAVIGNHRFMKEA